MNVSQASQVIDNLRNRYNFGLLEMLEIMTDEYESGGLSYFRQVYSLEERQAYNVLMDGFRTMFHGDEVAA
jgi:hypothetical protein